MSPHVSTKKLQICPPYSFGNISATDGTDRDLNVGFHQGLALVQGQIYNPLCVFSQNLQVMAEFVSLRRFIGEHFEQQNVPRFFSTQRRRNAWRDRTAGKKIQKRSHVPRSSKYMLKFGLFWVGFWSPNTSSKGVWMYRGTESGVKIFEAKMLRFLQIFV